MKCHRALVVFVCTLFLFPSLVRAEDDNAQDPIGFTEVAVKHVSAVEAGMFRRMLDKLSPVYIEDAVETSRESRAQFEFWDGSFLTMAPESRLALAEYVFDPADADMEVMAFTLGKGVFRAVTGEITKQQRHRVELETPMGILGVRGTDLVVEIRDDAENVTVLEGGPVTFTDKETQTTVDIPAGSFLSKLSGGAAVVSVGSRLSGEVMDSLAIDRDASLTAKAAVLGKGRTRVPEDRLEALEAVKASFLETRDKAAKEGIAGRRALDGNLRENYAGGLRSAEGGGLGLGGGGGFGGALGGRSGGLGGGGALGGRGGGRSGGRGGGGGGRR